MRSKWRFVASESFHQACTFFSTEVKTSTLRTRMTNVTYGNFIHVVGEGLLFIKSKYFSFRCEGLKLVFSEKFSPTFLLCIDFVIVYKPVFFRRIHCVQKATIHRSGSLIQRTINMRTFEYAWH